MNASDHIEKDIKSVNIKSTDIKRRLLMSSSTVETFQAFLKENIGNEVLVVNTNIGMEVYYYSANDYSIFIKESVLLYTLKHIDNKKLKFRSYLLREDVYRSFSEAILTFSKYPQIFLAYAKKFIFLTKKNTQSKFVMPILNDFFEETLKLLAKTAKIPHQEKIQTVKKKLEKTNNNNAISNLISEILLKKHLN
ncbi:hypothetical protein [Aquimarina sp. RZ0]|uniref:hypothetical protein n=1 Tax=Aquimarina sp. RZ0 TaxID=2607730 RepID=UPI0011F307BC|nr:hypothetical protein [Aquimarina sp. RZ0]KAA1247470.1 hypothetical protein F0000_03150 [Aquimarina sp. RZ0]